MQADQGQEKGIRRVILMQGQERLGPPDESVKAVLRGITDLDRLKRILRQTPKASNWQEILDTP